MSVENITVFCARSSRLDDVRAIHIPQNYRIKLLLFYISKKFVLDPTRFILWECDFLWNKTVCRKTYQSMTLKAANIRNGQYFILSEKGDKTPNSNYMDKMAQLRQEIYQLSDGLTGYQLGQLFTLEAFLGHLFKTSGSQEELLAARKTFLEYRLISRDVNLALINSLRIWNVFWPGIIGGLPSVLAHQQKTFKNQRKRRLEQLMETNQKKLVKYTKDLTSCKNRLDKITKIRNDFDERLDEIKKLKF